MKHLKLLLLLLIQQFCFGQSKIPVSILPISYESSNISQGDANMIQETIVTALFSTKRFVIVDREKLDEIEKEKKLQKTDAFMDNNSSIKDGVSIGASYLVVPTILQMDRQKEYKIQLKILDVSSGEIVATDIISSNAKKYPKSLIEIIEDNNKDKINYTKKITGESVLDALRINIIDFLNAKLSDTSGFSFVTIGDLDQKTILNAQKQSAFFIKPKSTNNLNIGDVLKIPNLGKAVVVETDSQDFVKIVMSEFYNAKFKMPKNNYLMTEEDRAVLVAK